MPGVLGARTTNWNQPVWPGPTYAVVVVAGRQALIQLTASSGRAWSRGAAVPM